MFDMMEYIVPIFFIIVIGMFIFTAVQGIGTWHKNNNSPELTVHAVVKTKRLNVDSYQNGVGGDMSGAHGFYETTDTTYYVTFEVESGDRMEFSVSGKEYGMLAEGDTGRLTFKGTRYLGFERE